MSKPIQQQMGPVEIVILLIISLLWGGAFFFVEILVETLTPLTIVTARVGLAAALLWGIVLVRKIDCPKRISDWGALAFVGLLSSALPFCLITWAQTQIDSGLASVLNATAPLFVVLVAGIALSDERLTLGKLMGVIAGIAGVAVLIGLDAVKGLGGSVLGQLAVIGAAFSYALAGVYARRFKTMGLSPIIVATGQLTTATVMLLPLAIIIDGDQIASGLSLLAMPLSVIASLLGLAFFSTVLANVLYFRLLESAGATNAALVGFLMPVTATALGIAFLGEAFTPQQVAGALLIGLGLLIIDGRLFRRPPKP